MLNTTVAIICGILVFGLYAAAIAWTIYNIKKVEIK